MTTDDDRQSTAERYQLATQSSHLRVQERRGDLDYMIAAGYLRDGLGALLYRLRTEYDIVRADIRAAEAKLPTWEKRAADVLAKIPAAAKAWRAPLKYGPHALQDEADRIREEARCYVLTERALALVNLKTLRPARDALGGFAIVLATKTLFMQDDAAALRIAGRVLDVWLDPLCHHCDGRGFTGGSHRGEPQMLCRPCRGSGHRRDWVGKTAEERQFASRLLLEIEQHQAAVDGRMRALLAQFDAGLLVFPDDVVESLRDRLYDMRSVQAEAD